MENFAPPSTAGSSATFDVSSSDASEGRGGDPAGPRTASACPAFGRPAEETETKSAAGRFRSATPTYTVLPHTAPRARTLGASLTSSSSSDRSAVAAFASVRPSVLAIAAVAASPSVAAEAAPAAAAPAVEANSAVKAEDEKKEEKKKEEGGGAGEDVSGGAGDRAHTGVPLQTPGLAVKDRVAPEQNPRSTSEKRAPTRDHQPLAVKDRVGAESDSAQPGTSGSGSSAAAAAAEAGKVAAGSSGDGGSMARAWAQRAHSMDASSSTKRAIMDKGDKKKSWIKGMPGFQHPRGNDQNPPQNRDLMEGAILPGGPQSAPQPWRISGPKWRQMQKQEPNLEPEA